MSDYLEENPHKVKNAAYYRRQMQKLEIENAELKRIIADSKEPVLEVTEQIAYDYGLIEGQSLYASPIITNNMELLGYAHQCDDYDGSVISTNKDEYGDKTVAIYKIKETK